MHERSVACIAITAHDRAQMYVLLTVELDIGDVRGLRAICLRSAYMCVFMHNNRILALYNNLGLQVDELAHLLASVLLCTASELESDKARAR